MKHHRVSLVLRIVLGAAVLGIFARGALAQTAVSVTAASSSFQSWMTPSGAIQVDPFADQQTGIPAADFLGVTAGTAGLTPAPAVNVPGAMMTAGTLQSADQMVFRFRLVDKNGNKTYMGSALSIGINLPELTVAGKPTIFVTLESSQSGNTLFFQSPGTGANDSPSTTTLDGGAFAGSPYSRAAPLTLTAGTNFSYTPLASLPIPETSYDRSGTSGTDVNSFATFAVKFTDLQAATRALTGNTTFTMNYSTEMAFLAVTASQYNSINQDIYGTATQASNNLTTTWSAMGAFSDYVTATGFKKPIPEASTVLQVGMLLVIGLAGGVYRRRKAGLSFRPANGEAA